MKKRIRKMFGCREKWLERNIFFVVEKKNSGHRIATALALKTALNVAAVTEASIAVTFQLKTM